MGLWGLSATLFLRALKGCDLLLEAKGKCLLSTAGDQTSSPDEPQQLGCSPGKGSYTCNAPRLCFGPAFSRAVPDYFLV